MNELKEQILKNYYVSLQSATFTLDKDGNSTMTDKGMHKIVQIPIDDLMQLIETYTDKKCLEALEQVSFDMYDINDLEWGIPTKWSVKDENDNHADLWIPQESAVEKIQYRINQLSTELTNKEIK
jgi:hypothetical protein